MGSEDAAFAALKVFLVVGPLLGFAALEVILLRRDKRRAAAGLPLVPARFGGAPRSAAGRGRNRSGAHVRVRHIDGVLPARR